MKLCNSKGTGIHFQNKFYRVNKNGIVIIPYQSKII